MADILIADDGVPFDGASLDSGPLGGAETAVIELARALAARGHQVAVHNRCRAPLDRDGVAWRPLGDGLPAAADLYVANRGDRLIGLVPKAGARAFWLHNPAGYLLKWRYLWKLWNYRPEMIFLGRHHAGTYPALAPGGGRHLIPYGIAEIFRQADAAPAPPPPRAIFTSNPLRGLDWLLDRWEAAIRPAVPEAELHVYGGAATYAGTRHAGAMETVLDRARRTAGVLVHPPVAKAALVVALQAARVMLYRGDVGETFCLALAEAQAVGLPAVVQAVGAVPERVRDGETGFVASDDEAFCAHAVAVLTDDVLWRRQQAAARATQRARGWNEAAADFELLLPPVEAA